MKRCPECRRDYYDDSLMYCLDDGTALLEGPISLSDDPPTAVFKEKTDASSFRGTSEDATHVYTAIVSEPLAKPAAVTTQNLSKRLPLFVGLLALVLTAGAGLVGYRYLRSSEQSRN